MSTTIRRAAALGLLIAAGLSAPAISASPAKVQLSCTKTNAASFQDGTSEIGQASIDFAERKMVFRDLAYGVAYVFDLEITPDTIQGVDDEDTTFLVEIDRATGLLAFGDPQNGMTGTTLQCRPAGTTRF